MREKLYDNDIQWQYDKYYQLHFNYTCKHCTKNVRMYAIRPYYKETFFHISIFDRRTCELMRLIIQGPKI